MRTLPTQYGPEIEAGQSEFEFILNRLEQANNPPSGFQAVQTSAETPVGTPGRLEQVAYDDAKVRLASQPHFDAGTLPGMSTGPVMPGTEIIGEVLTPNPQRREDSPSHGAWRAPTRSYRKTISFLTTGISFSLNLATPRYSTLGASFPAASTRFLATTTWTFLARLPWQAAPRARRLPVPVETRSSVVVVAAVTSAASFQPRALPSRESGMVSR